MMMKPLQIGNLCIDRPVILAPMAGVTDLPFRVLCREQGCGMVCTEMVSAKAITYKNKNTFLLMETVHRNARCLCSYLAQIRISWQKRPE